MESSCLHFKRQQRYVTALKWNIDPFRLLRAYFPVISWRLYGKTKIRKAAQPRIIWSHDVIIMVRRKEETAHYLPCHEYINDVSQTSFPFPFCTSGFGSKFHVEASWLSLAIKMNRVLVRCKGTVYYSTIDMNICLFIIPLNKLSFTCRQIRICR